ncbi:MAG: hypothetical protein A2015_12550 [Spirochaetes bacterium GWF1_31_7]|nr:MAG: hypothetical protein A2Y30_12460 [Spirochaetes bacterium GWE1_32_154]OHD44819.1 MAG: hypothetical protein A2Y29_03415 [Spirochaetes bacterium GWE2_31_10]OHD49610.1 MAG: hypothetical protein A2015_12550 [Spirochaetes bacterium GWF1_31_7]OHD82759.1 MAG: hypothetical protein A2355_05295 [Spirochaetes bacterium RIFOXYB1_FULL_32_8]HBD93751.1 hypothetical protein [Spirochaetia bacterium]
MRLIVKPVKTERLHLYTEESTVFIKGSIDLQYPKPILEPFFTDLHNDLLYYGFRFITLDITGLTFINSSGIRELLAWLIKLTKLPKDDRYEIFINTQLGVNCQQSISKSFTLIYQGAKVINKEIIV